MAENTKDIAHRCGDRIYLMLQPAANNYCRGVEAAVNRYSLAVRSRVWAAISLPVPRFRPSIAGHLMIPERGWL